MKAIGVVTDSHSGIGKEEAEKLGILVVPMPFYIEEQCYYENVSISREEFIKKLEAGINVSTSQPSPQDVMDVWDKALQDYEQIVYMPISSGLSGSCDMARMLAQEPEYEGKVFVVDNGRVSALLHSSVLDSLELIEEGYTAAEIKEILEASRDEMVIYIAVETMEYLKKGGRVTGATAALGTILHIKPVLKFDVGVLETYEKCRGMKKARQEMLKAMKRELEERFREYYDRKEICLLAASSADDQTTREWEEEIKAFFPGVELLSDPLTCGLACHIGPGGLGIGCSCRPKRSKGL